MSFNRIDLLPHYNFDEAKQARDRWQSDNGRELYDQIIGLIHQGAGDNFLQYEFDGWNAGSTRRSNTQAAIPPAGADLAAEAARERAPAHGAGTRPQTLPCPDAYGLFVPEV